MKSTTLSTPLSSTIAAIPPINLRLFDELNDFLPARQRNTALNWTLTRSLRIKELISEIGIPSSAISLILVDGESVDLDYQLQGGERVSVCPAFEAFDPAKLTG